METTISVRRVAIGDLEHEYANTRKVLSRLPAAHFSWKPHEKSFSLGALGTHVANLPYWVLHILTNDEIDLSAPMPPNPLGSTAEELVQRFDSWVAQVKEQLEKVDDEFLMGVYTIRMGDHIISQMPRTATIRGFGLSHLIHHRAQLTVYLRLLDQPVPSLYGPSADEQ